MNEKELEEMQQWLDDKMDIVEGRKPDPMDVFTNFLMFVFFVIMVLWLLL